MSLGVDFDLHVHYGFVWLAAPGVLRDDLIGARAGQRNGICGAAYPGVLSMLTGLHTGVVPFRVEVWDSEPPLDDGWEDVVEVDFEAPETELILSPFQGAETIVLPAAGSYRARYCASGMDAAAEQDTRLDSDEVTDRYLLALWPAAPAGERVARQTSARAAYWAQVAAKTPLPVPPTAEELAEAERVGREARARDAAKRERQMDAVHWRGVDPTPEMRLVGPRIAGVAASDFELAQLIATATDEGRRLLALWAVEQVCRLAATAPLNWGIAIAALSAGEPLPPPFDDSRTTFSALFNPEPDTVGATGSTMRREVRIGRVAGPHEHVVIHPSAAAGAAVRAAADPDPVLAAIGALEQAAAGMQDRAKFYAQARRRFTRPPTQDD